MFKILKDIFSSKNTRTRVSLELHHGTERKTYSRWFKFIMARNAMERLTAEKIGLPQACTLLYKKEGYVISSFSHQKDTIGTYLSIKCKVIVHDSAYNPLTRDIRLLTSSGWSEGS